MPRMRYKPEEIVAKLRQVDVMVSQGQPVAAAVRSIGVTEVNIDNLVVPQYYLSQFFKISANIPENNSGKQEIHSKKRHRQERA